MKLTKERKKGVRRMLIESLWRYMSDKTKKEIGELYKKDFGEPLDHNDFDEVDDINDPLTFLKQLTSGTLQIRESELRKKLKC